MFLLCLEMFIIVLLFSKGAVSKSVSIAMPLNLFKMPINKLITHGTRIRFGGKVGRGYERSCSLPPGQSDLLT